MKLIPSSKARSTHALARSRSTPHAVGQPRAERRSPTPRGRSSRGGDSASGETTAVEVIQTTVELPTLTLTIEHPPDAVELIDELAFEHEEFLPYWAEVWPSGVALARFVASRALRGTRVLELGCGLALPSIAASLQGARGARDRLVPGRARLRRAERGAKRRRAGDRPRRHGRAPRSSSPEGRGSSYSRLTCSTSDGTSSRSSSGCPVSAPRCCWPIPGGRRFGHF